MFRRYDSRDMDQVTVSENGTSHCVVIPAAIMRALGWIKGDRCMVFVKGGDIVYRNDTQRAARFTREFKANKEHHVSADAR
jgi:antitoxin component of MazEF toxin-antitoxin module